MERVYTHVSPEHVRAQMGKRTSKAFDTTTGGGQFSVADTVLCYHVDTTGFQSLGRVNCVSTASQFGYWFSSAWRRAAIIGNVLYAVTDEGVRAAPVPA